MAYVRINISENQCPEYAYPVVRTIPNRSTYTFTQADFTLNYNDPEGDPFGGIKLIGLPASGSLELNGLPITSASAVSPVFISASDIAAGKFVYIADQNNINAHSVDIPFLTCDDKEACCDGIQKV